MKDSLLFTKLPRLIAAASLALHSVTAFADTYQWEPQFSDLSDWNSLLGNWAGGSATFPVAGDTAQIDANSVYGNVSPTKFRQNNAVQSISFNVQYPGGGTYSPVTVGGQVSMYSLTLQTAGGSGTSTITPSTYTSQSTFACDVQIDPSITSVTVSGAGTVIFQESLTSTSSTAFIVDNGAVVYFEGAGNSFPEATLSIGPTAASTLVVTNPTALGSGSTYFTSGAINHSGILSMQVSDFSSAVPFTLTNTAIFDVEIPDSSTIITATLTGALTGTGGLTKTGSGTLVLTSSSNSYTGPTAVNAGTLFVADGAVLGNTALTVASGAALSGSGTIGTGAKTVTNNGSISPMSSQGGPPGALTIDGAYVQNSGGTLNIQIASATNYSQLVIEGAATITGSSLNISPYDSPVIAGGNTLTILSATGGVTGTFTSVHDTLPALSTYSVDYLTDSVIISNIYVPPAPTLPTHAVAYAAPVLSNAQQTILDFTRRLQRMRPSQPFGQKSSKTSIKTAANGMQQGNMIAEAERVQSIEIGEAVVAETPYREPQRSTSSILAIEPRTQGTWGVFADGLGSVGRIYKNPVAGAFKYSSVGGEIGFDYVDDWYGVGFSPEYMYTSAHSVDHTRKFHIQSALGTAFATFMPAENKNFFVDAILGGGYQWYNFVKYTVRGPVTGSTHGGQVYVYGDIGYTYAMVAEKAFLIPLLGLGYVGVFVKGFNEQGSIEQAFDVGKNNINSLRASAGLSANYMFSGKYVTFIPEGRFLYQREFLNHTHGVNYASVPLEVNAQVQVLGLGRNSIFLGAVLRFLLPKEIEAYTSYDYEWNSSFHSHLFFGSIAKRF